MPQLSSLALAAFTAVASGAALQPRDIPGPIINFANNTGTPKHLASGILYGLPDNQTQIPSTLLSGFGFNYGRAAGAQVGHGWSWSQPEFEIRFKSALSNYQLTRSHNGGFVLLLNDLWGFDTTQNSSSLAPGDDGDWSSYDRFLARLVQLINSNNMKAGLVIDIWNEPEGSAFWNRSIDQWLAMWGRGQAFGTNSVLLSGPTTAGQPSLSYNWWYEWASFVSSNASIPDQYVWHEEAGTGSSLSKSYNGLTQIQAKYKLPKKQININEYAIYNEEVPAGSAFWISQLERINAIGLRGNWLGGTKLHDFAASLLSKPDQNNYAATGYFTNGDYQVYKYYSQNMTGSRYGTSVSPDGIMDAYATVDCGHVRCLMGVRPPATGTYSVTFTNLSSLGLPTSGSISVRTWKFPVASDVHFGRVDAPIDLGTLSHTYSKGQLVLPYYSTDNVTTYAWEWQV
ncbi:hypothetical protein LTR86_003254 [Recurvomyces mirabilis]|nr:hypothetical protein LTR86_003254 [Recurvomyces mirabilis]